MRTHVGDMRAAMEARYRGSMPESRLMKVAPGGANPRHPIQSYRWAAALQLYGNASERAAVPELLVLAISPTPDLVTQSEIDTAVFLNKHVPKAERAAARQRIYAHAEELRATAMGKSGRTVASSGRKKGPRSAGLDASDDTLLGAILAAGAALLLLG